MMSVMTRYSDCCYKKKRGRGNTVWEVIYSVIMILIRRELSHRCDLLGWQNVTSYTFDRQPKKLIYFQAHSIWKMFSLEYCFALLLIVIKVTLINSINLQFTCHSYFTFDQTQSCSVRVTYTLIKKICFLLWNILGNVYVTLL